MPAPVPCTALGALFLALHLAACCSADQPALRFWLDDYAFGPGETELLAAAVAAAPAPGAEVAGRTPTRFLLLKGFQQSRKWDVYWTNRKVSCWGWAACDTACAPAAQDEGTASTPLRISTPETPCMRTPTPLQACSEAFKRPLRPGQLVNCVPGLEAVTEKARLFRSLEVAFGAAAAAAVAPLTYSLPGQYFQLAALLQKEVHLVQQPCFCLGTDGSALSASLMCRNCPPTTALHFTPPPPLPVKQGGVEQQGRWVLKEEAHQGKGVRIVPPCQLLAVAVERQAGRQKFALAQRLIAKQLLVQGRPFYVRYAAPRCLGSRCCLYPPRRTASPPSLAEPSSLERLCQPLLAPA